jgi:hypothetical protein
LEWVDLVVLPLEGNGAGPLDLRFSVGSRLLYSHQEDLHQGGAWPVLLVARTNVVVTGLLVANKTIWRRNVDRGLVANRRHQLEGQLRREHLGANSLAKQRQDHSRPSRQGNDDIHQEGP